MMLDLSYWKLTGLQAPWGPFDVNAGLNFSFDLTDWVEASGVALAAQSVVVLAQPKLAFTAPTLVGSVFTVRIDKVDPSIDTDLGTMIPFTLRMTLSDTQHDDRTFYLQMRQR